MSKHLKGAFKDKKTLEKFGYSVLGYMGALIWNMDIFRRTKFTLDITSYFGYSAMFSNLRLLFSGTQLTSDITSKILIVLKKNIGGIILKKPKFRRKVRILKQSYNDGKC